MQQAGMQTVWNLAAREDDDIIWTVGLYSLQHGINSSATNPPSPPPTHMQANNSKALQQTGRASTKVTCSSQTCHQRPGSHR